MAFPPSFLEELRTRLQLSGVVAHSVKLVRAGREFKACCPFHNEKSPSFYVNDDKQFYHCFGCGAHGDVIGFTMRFNHLSFPEAIETLAGQAGLSVPQDTPQERERYDLEKRLYQVLERTTAWFEEQLFAPSGREALNYLRGRGMTEEAIRRFHLGYAPNDSQAIVKKLTGEGFSMAEITAVGLAKKSEDRPDYFSFFRNRVMFPVGDRRGRTVAFGGRVLGDGEPKYLNSPDHELFHKGKLLYGLSRARTAVTQGQPIVVVEGYMDVIALVEEGFYGAVAPLGTALTEDQISILWKLLPPSDTRDPTRDYSPILCFDGDNAGLRASARGIDRALPLLTSTNTLRVAYLPEGEDPDSLIRHSGKSAIQAIFDNAKPMIDVIWNLTLAGRKLQTPEERGSFISSIKQRVSRIKDESLRGLYQDEVQKRIAGAFNWQPQGKTGFKSGRRDFNQSIVPDGLSRKHPLNPQRLRERVLLAIILNHPALFEEFGDDLAQIGFSSPDLETIRQRTVDLLSTDSHETLDVAELYRHLSDGADTKVLAMGLSETLSEATYVHAGFARPDRSIEQARQGWKSIWNKYLQELLHADLQMARRHYAEDASEANLTRLLALREQIETLAHETAGNENEEQQLSSV